MKINSNTNIDPSFEEWKKNVLKMYDGRVLVHFQIDFNLSKIVSFSVASVVINENKCNIVGFDTNRSAVIYDTMPSAQQQREFATTIKKQNDKFHLELEQAVLGIPAYARYTAATHCYKMIRLNDLVDYWRKVL